MTEGRRRDEPPGPTDPWANLARIEASLRADAQAFGLPVPDELPAPLLGGPLPAPERPSRPAAPPARPTPPEDAQDGGLRRDRSRLRAAEPAPNGIQAPPVEPRADARADAPARARPEPPESRHESRRESRRESRPEPRPGARRRARAAERRGGSGAGASRLTIGPGRRPTAGAPRLPEPSAVPEATSAVPEAAEMPAVAVAPLTPRALRFTDLPEDGLTISVAPATAPVAELATSVVVPSRPAPPTAAAPVVGAVARPAALDQPPTRPVPSRPPVLPPERTAPWRPEPRVPELDFDLVLNEPSPARRSRLPFGGRKKGSSPRRPAKPARPSTTHPNQPRLTGLLDGRRVPMLAAGLVICLVLIGVVYGINAWSDPGPSSGVTRTETASQLSGAPEAVASPEVTLPGVEPTHSTVAQARKVKLGVFRGTDPPAVGSFGRWLGRDPQVVIDFSARDTWEHIADPDYMIQAWRNSGYRVVYSTALLPESGGATIAAGSRGAYDTYYKRLARNLVAAGEGDSIIRLGWEFNLATSKWSTANTRQFISYWRHVVTAMRSVPGERFEFDWNPNIGATAYDATRYWPGDDYVDYVGADVYDVSWQENTYPYPADCTTACRRARQEVVWQRLYNGPHGLGFWADFARSKGKPLSLPEWGLWERPDGHGGGENPYFIEQMWRFIADPQNNVAYQAYFETVAEDGNHRLMTSLTTSGKLYRKLFGR